MKIALGQIEITWEDKEKTKEKVLSFIKQAATQGVDLLLFPEMTLTGFSMKVAQIGEETQETVAWFQAQAKIYNLSLGFGHVGKIPSSTKGKNLYTLLTPKGEQLTYAKIHPFSFGEETQFYHSGEAISFFSLKDFTICPYICYDLRFPELFQIASKKANLITVAANWPEARREHWMTLLKARAIENQCYVAGVNRVGTGNGLSYTGDSMIIDPLGKVLVHLYQEEGLLIANLEKEEVETLRTAFPLKADRKEGLYRSFFAEK